MSMDQIITFIETELSIVVSRKNAVVKLLLCLLQR
jgi:hypothetical protein